MLPPLRLTFPPATSNFAWGVLVPIPTLLFVDSTNKARLSLDVLTFGFWKTLSTIGRENVLSAGLELKGIEKLASSFQNVNLPSQLSPGEEVISGEFDPANPWPW